MRGRKSNHVACVHCRQMKLACDRRKEPPESCSRCLKTGKICSVDPSFKREKKREQLEAVRRELQQTKKRLRAESQQDQLSDDIVAETALVLRSGRNGRIRSSIDSPSMRDSQRVEVLLNDKTIGGVHLPASVIQDLLNEYYARYHSFCPILPRQSIFLTYSDSSVLLLSTVLVVASRRRLEHREIYISLCDVVRALVADSIWPANGSILSLQAILLLCCWPLPFQRNEDPSHVFVAQATHLGLRLGLHRPGHETEFDNSSSDGEREMIQRMTWVTCFITNVSISAQLGLPATVRLDCGLLGILTSKPSWLPDTLFSQLHIARQALNIGSTLGDCMSSNTGLLDESAPFVRNFEAELRVLEFQSHHSWSPADRIIYCGTQIMLYTLALTIDSSKSKNAVHLDSQSHWLVCASVAATTTIQTALSMGDQLLYAPARLQKIVLNAICLLLLMKGSRYSELVEKHTLDNAINQGRELLRDLSTTTGDFMSRACSLLDQLGRFTERLKPEDKTEQFLLVRLRMGANVPFTTAIRAREALRKSHANTPHDIWQEPDMSDLDLQDIDLPLGFDWSELFGMGLDF